MPLVPILSLINPIQSSLYLLTWKWLIDPDTLSTAKLIKIKEFSITCLNLFPLTIMYGRDLSVIFSSSSSSSSTSSSCSRRVRSVTLFLNPQDEVGPSISSLVVQCSFVLSVYIVMLVLVVHLCPSSVRVVATFSGIVLFPLLYSVLLFFP